MTTSFSSFRYMVKSIPRSTAIAEYPSPNSLCHSRRGPVAGQVVARPFVSEVKLRCGPPHCAQSDDCARAAVFVVNNNSASSTIAFLEYIILVTILSCKSEQVRKGGL